MDILLTLRSSTHSSTGFVYPTLVYAQSAFDVETERHEHLANYAFYNATAHVPQVGVLYTGLSTLPSVYAFALPWRRVLHLLWTFPTVIEALHKARKYPLQRKGSSLIRFA